MSSSLHWRPVNHEGEPLGSDLKFLMRRILDEGFATRIDDWTEVGPETIPVLKGALYAARGPDQAAATKAAIEELIALIERHGSIEIKEVD